MTVTHQPTAGMEPPDPPSPFCEERSHKESLRSKIVLSLAAVFLLFVTVNEFARRRFIEPQLDELVTANAVQDANRVLSAFTTEAQRLTARAGFYVRQRPTERHIESNAETPSHYDSVTETHLQQSFDWVAIVSGTDQLKWNARLSEPTEKKHTREAIQSLLKQITRREDTHGIASMGGSSLALYGLIKLETAHGPSPSYLLIAQKIDNALLDSIRRKTNQDFELRQHRLDNQRRATAQRKRSELTVELPLQLPNQQPGNYFSIEVPRKLAATSERTTRIAGNIFLLGGVAICLILMHLLNKIVIRPLTKVQALSVRMLNPESNAKALNRQGEDEIHDLEIALNRLSQRLCETEQKLEQIPDDKTCTQVASSVIHNIGNVQTNVSSLIEAACDRTRRLRISPLHKLAERMRAEEPDAAMMRKTPDYLEGLAESLQSDQRSINELLRTLNDNVRHIRDIIREQQHQTKPSLTIAPIQVRDLIDEAILCCRASLETDAIKITVSGQVQAQVLCDRSLALQTIINLISNARNALRSIEAHTRHLQIHVRSQPGQIEIDFQDNGCGLAPEILCRIFDSQFTTRDSGTGLGLHFCALTLERLGGSIRATSEGPNRGSVFTIGLPHSTPNLVDSPQTNASGKTP